MTFRTIVVIVLALVCGASMAVGVLRSNANTASPKSVSSETVPVLVAAATLGRGHAIGEKDVIVRECPKELATESMLTDVEAVKGQIVGYRIFQNEPILQEKLRGEGSENGIDVMIDEGKRAYTIQTSRVASNVAGLIRPRNIVDVLLNFKGSRGDSTGGGSTTTLLQAVEVLAVAQHLEAPDDYDVAPDEMTSVTLHVTPQQANELDVGQNLGVLTLSLRNPNDLANVETVPSTVADIQFLPGQAPPLGIPVGMVDEPRPPEAEPLRREEPKPVWIVTLRGQKWGRVLVSDGQDE